VATIDHAKRVVNIKTSDGKFETVDVPAGAKRFDELKVGDKVSITYNNNVSARLKPPGEAAVDTGSMTTTAGQQTRPGGTTAVQRTMTVTVDAIDKSASSITFVGPNGWKYSRRVVDPTVFDKVKTLVPSGRGELEITDVNNAYIQEGTMTFSFLEGWWTDAGTFDSLLRAGQLVAQSRQPQPSARVLEKANV
jgi:hypothetical protein